MWLQAAALIWIAREADFVAWALASLLLGIGTAMVYPALIAAVSDAAAPSWRAGAVGVYRFWRDLGYAIGAVGAGLVADRWGFPAAIALTGIVTFLSGVVVLVLMRESRRSI
jgi:predicted MFS family arabinose efflux permease